MRRLSRDKCFPVARTAGALVFDVFFSAIDPCDIRHVGRRNNAICLLWEMKSIVMQEYFIVLSSNMALSRRGGSIAGTTKSKRDASFSFLNLK